MYVVPEKEWRPTTLNGRPTYSVTCRCGSPIILDEHTVTADGLVSPRVACPQRNCGFDELIRLAGFNS